MTIIYCVTAPIPSLLYLSIDHSVHLYGESISSLVVLSWDSLTSEAKTLIYNKAADRSAAPLDLSRGYRLTMGFFSLRECYYHY